MNDPRPPSLPASWPASLGTRMQRMHGRARLEYRHDAARGTVLADLYQRAPCRLLFPDVERGEPPQAVLLTTCGGLTGGDRIETEIVLGPGAAAVVSTQAAEKLYRALPGEPDTRMDFQLRLGEGAWLEWLAQETILFEGARLRRRIEVDLAPGARLLAVESAVFGRSSMGERFEHGRFFDAWRIRRGGRLVWADGLCLDGDVAAQRALSYGFGTSLACATLLYAAADAQTLLPCARALLEPRAELGAATAFDGLLILRLMTADASALRGAMADLASGLRAAAAGLPARLPRVWYC